MEAHPRIAADVEPQERQGVRLWEEAAEQLCGEEAEPLLRRVEAGIVGEVAVRSGPAWEHGGLPSFGTLRQLSSGRRHLGTDKVRPGNTTPPRNSSVGRKVPKGRG